MSDIWSLVHAERAALVRDLEDVDPGRWELPSPCAGWSVHDVVAHLVDTALTTRLGFVLGLTRAGFDFDRQNARGVRRHRGSDPAATLDRLRAVSSRRTTPPAPLASRLVEEVVHGEDVRRPLGTSHTYAPAAVEGALAHLAGTPAAFGGARELVGRVRLEASDTGYAVGTGPVVSATALDLLLLASGRPVDPAGVDGPGAALLPGKIR